MKRLHYILGWMFVRPRRWLFWKMVANCYLQLIPKHDSYLGWSWPNLHWWILYKTVFTFFKWLEWDAWRPFCKWKDGWINQKPIIARVIQRIGQTTAGAVCHGGECYHCGSKEGNPVDLVDDDTGKTFRLKETWTESSEDGTDYRFCGTTICPKCGYESYYEDGSL